MVKTSSIHLFKEMFDGSKFDIGCLMMLNGPNKFIHLFKEMFEGYLILDA